MTKHKVKNIVFAAVGMLLLILDSRGSIAGAVDAVSVCLKTVIPSLFPFFFCSILLTGSLFGSKIPLIRPIGKICGIPEGGESVLIVGLLGGYPVGAQCIHQAWQEKKLSTEDAQHMLTFCSNAGPAFIFGIAGSLFASHAAPWLLWLIQIISAMLTGILLCKSSPKAVFSESTQKMSISMAMEKALRATASVCGWVMIFRILNTVLGRWFLWVFPVNVQTMIAGILELTNGCLLLHNIADMQLRFVMCSVLLSFGGLCVTMQTASVIGKLGLKWYLKGKILQSALSFIFASLAQGLLFSERNKLALSTCIVILCGTIILAVIGIKKKNRSRFSEKAIV